MKKEGFLGIRLTPLEENILNSGAKDEDLSKSDYVRKKLFGNTKEAIKRMINKK